ncbi:hypothetical protein BBK_5473 [Burkholderia pseudomallei NCTC 13179]|nr:hypothetical protein BBK_5473 [Burkholderia pseudomallei NCTC 13179]
MHEDNLTMPADGAGVAPADAVSARACAPRAAVRSRPR